ncbi:BglG family transcription antiterminator [Alteribacillus persepolensis]|uniref:BglG family transcription antiterminator n=1 Tax=Alteribacillus persepolensis TaxID=568899 RepID=UPI001113A203|nr:BglG family transcription antiterminator [Alteribacillus persepolensis]
MSDYYVTARERALLHTLLEKENPVPVSKIAKELQVSTRTIHRDVQGMEKLLGAYHLELVKKTGKGMWIAGATEDKQDLRLALLQTHAPEYTEEERRTLILSALLEAEEPVKLNTLSHELKVSAATVSYDLDKIEEWLQGFGLELVRRRGYGVKISGAEASKRNAMSGLIAENLEETDLFEAMQQRIKKRSVQTDTSPISNRLLGLVEKEKWVTVEQILHEMKDTLPYSFADSAYIGLVVHVTLAVERLQKGENIEINQEHLHSLKNTKEFEAANQLIQRLERVFQLDIPEAEIGYITMHLRGAKLRQEPEQNWDLDHLPAAACAKALMSFVQHETGKPLVQDHSLYQGLTSHLEPALFRLKENMKIHNPLLDDIKRDYPELFSIVKKAAGYTLPEMTLPEAEIGYLVLHFGSALEQLRDKQKARALVVCSSGIGSSKMLTTRLKKEVPEIEQMKNMSVLELENIDESNYDLVISTVDITHEQLPSITVNPFLTKEDAARVKSLIHQLELKKHIPYEQDIQAGNETRSAERDIESIQLYSWTMIRLLQQFDVYRPAFVQDVYSALEEVCHNLKERQLITSAGKTAQALWERHKAGGMAIPNTRLALFHTRGTFVSAPCFVIQVLPQSVYLPSMDGTLTEVKHLLLLLAPDNEEVEVYEVLSAVSEQIIQTDQSIQTFASGDKQRIQSFMAQSFRERLKEKIT